MFTDPCLSRPCKHVPHAVETSCQVVEVKFYSCLCQDNYLWNQMNKTCIAQYGTCYFAVYNMCSLKFFSCNNYYNLLLYPKYLYYIENNYLNEH